MSAEGFSTSAHSPCGHRNPPNSRFCDVCGAKLPMQCPRCHAINREEANFCGSCGSALRDSQRAHATPPVAPSRASSERPPVPRLGPIPAPLEASAPAKQPEHQSIPAPDPLDALSRVTDGAQIWDESDKTRRLIERVRERRRLARRRWVWLGTASAAIGIGIFGATLLFGGVPSRARLGADRSAAVVPVSSHGENPPAIPPRDNEQGRPGSVPAPLPSLAPTPIQATGADRIELPAAALTTPAAKEDVPDAIGGHTPPASPPPPSPEKPPAIAAPVPRVGGELTFLVPAEPPSYDAHREETFALIHPAAPHYNTLLRIDPTDRSGTRVVGDLAESWAVSADKRTYILKLRRGVKFHDGSEMTSQDVRASYEKIINPPPGIISVRKGEYLEIETIQTPEPYVVAFKLKWPSPSFIHSLASPWNWIYKAEILERDVRWYETHVMGTGPFVFVEHVRGSHWVGQRNPSYWDSGKPYLDGYRALFVRDDAAQAFAIRAGRADIQFRGFSPAQRDDIVRTLGEKVTVQESPWNCGLVVALNHEKKPFDDRRVRRALSLALDRYQAAGALSKIAIVRDVAGVQVPNSPFATPPAELVKLAGYWRDIRKSRGEARRLLAEGKVREGFSFVLKNRNVPMPYEYLGTWLVDQWRQIGLKVRQEIQESGLYFKDLRAGNFDVSTDFQCGYVVDPDLDLYKFQSQHLSDSNYSRYTDPVLDDLYRLQSRTVDPEQRRQNIRAFEKRLLDEEAHYIYTLQWHRIVPHSSRVRGWTITPSHYLNSQLDTVWLSE
jgi:peptide/nickel transport system substrate-binding protein